VRTLPRRDRILMLVVPAIALLSAIVVVSVVGGGGHPRTPIRTPAQIDAIFAGIPQSGPVLGSPHSPVTLVEFADPQCPFCADWSRTELPTIVRRYVRPGNVRIVFRGLHFIGPDSEVALRAAVAAGTQGKLWQLVQALDEHQGHENTGWVTDGLLQRLGAGVRGLDTARMLRERQTPAVDAALEANDRLAQRLDVRATPTFFVARRGEPLREVERSAISETLARLTSS
jgi:protein-disulfide isomerase